MRKKLCMELKIDLTLIMFLIFFFDVKLPRGDHFSLKTFIHIWVVKFPSLDFFNFISFLPSIKERKNYVFKNKKKKKKSRMNIIKTCWMSKGRIAHNHRHVLPCSLPSLYAIQMMIYIHLKTLSHFD